MVFFIDWYLQPNTGIHMTLKKYFKALNCLHDTLYFIIRAIVYDTNDQLVEIVII